MVGFQMVNHSKTDLQKVRFSKGFRIRMFGIRAPTLHDFHFQAPPLKRGGGDTAKREIAKRDVLKSDIVKRDVTTCVVAPISRTTLASSLDRRQTYHFDDAFEDAIANQIDALDDITDDGGSSKEPTPEQQRHHQQQQQQQSDWKSATYSSPPRNESSASLPPLSGGKITGLSITL